MKKRRIVLVANDAGGVGGMEKHLEEMIDRLKKDYPVTVIASSLRLKDPAGVEFIRIPAPRKPFPVMIACFSVLASIRIWFLRNCVVHSTGAIVFNPVDFSTVHFCHAGYVAAGGRRTARGDKGRQSWLRKVNDRVSLSIKLWAERFCYQSRKAGRLIAVSSRIRGELTQAYAFPRNRIEVIPNGVNLERFCPKNESEKKELRRQTDLPEDGTYLLFMGGDWERKGLRRLLQAFNQLAGDYAHLHVLVVGPGDVETYEKIITVNYRRRVHFLGKRVDPENWYGMTDIFVFPSQYEACSLAVLEAAASGLAMVLTDVGGAQDVIEDGINGYLVEPFEPAIAEAIQRLLDNPQKLREFGAGVRKRVESMSWDHMYKKVRQMYDELLQEKPLPASQQESQGLGSEETVKTNEDTSDNDAGVSVERIVHGSL